MARRETGDMGRLLLIKLARAFVTLLFCVTFVFIVLRVTGDPATQLLPDDTPSDILDEYRARWGLDKPVWEQYLLYVKAVATGDFGISFADDRRAAEVIAERLPATLLLGSVALSVAILIGMPLGITAALYRGTGIDRFVMGLAVFGYSIPNFFLAILLILLFALQWRILPSAGSETLAHLIMPAITLGTATAGKIARYVRASMLEVIGLPFMRAVRGKGVSPLGRILRHALPNAAIPVVTFLGFELGSLIGGAVVTEFVFAWPGVGRLLVVSVGQRDLAVVQALILLIAFTMVTANLLVDLAYGWLDPRVRALAVRQ